MNNLLLLSLSLACSALARRNENTITLDSAQTLDKIEKAHAAGNVDKSLYPRRSRGGSRSALRDRLVSDEVRDAADNLCDKECRASRRASRRERFKKGLKALMIAARAINDVCSCVNPGVEKAMNIFSLKDTISDEICGKIPAALGGTLTLNQLKEEAEGAAAAGSFVCAFAEFDVVGTLKDMYQLYGAEWSESSLEDSFPALMEKVQTWKAESEEACSDDSACAEASVIFSGLKSVVNIDVIVQTMQSMALEKVLKNKAEFTIPANTCAPAVGTLPPICTWEACLGVAGAKMLKTSKEFACKLFEFSDTTDFSCTQPGERWATYRSKLLAKAKTMKADSSLIQIPSLKNQAPLLKEKAAKITEWVQSNCKEE